MINEFLNIFHPMKIQRKVGKLIMFGWKTSHERIPSLPIEVLKTQKHDWQMVKETRNKQFKK